MNLEVVYDDVVPRRPNFLLDVLRFASYAHLGQIRKATGDPYIMHPIRVAHMVSTVISNNHALAAALLHDVVEDTLITINDIDEKFGTIVSQMVFMLTDPPKSEREDMNRAARKEETRLRLADASGIVQTIKVADIIDNIEDLTVFDKDFAKLYSTEQRALLNALTKADKTLLKLANDKLDAQGYF